MTSLTGFFEENKKPLFFLLKLTAIYLSWKLFSLIMGDQHEPFSKRYFPFISFQWETLNQGVRMLDIHSTEFLLNLVGYETQNWNDYYFSIQGKGSLRVGNYCLGFQLWYYFFGLILISHIQFWPKIISAFFTFLVVQTLNVIRLFGMALMTVYAPDYLHLIHDYLFNISVLICLFYVYTVLNKKYPSNV